MARPSDHHSDHRIALRARTRPRAFTLIEVLVAVVITAAIAGAATTAVSRALSAQDIARARQQALARATLAVDTLAADAQNIARSADLYDARLLIVDASLASGDPRDEILLFTRQARPLRPPGDQNEGDTYEIQYRLQNPDDPAAVGYILWRRTDPVPDEVPDGGGIASPLVIGLASLSIQAFDGSSWLDDWDSDRDGYPHALRITASARDDSSRRIATARRTIAIDRTPLPFATAITETGSQQASSGGAQ